MWFIWKAQCRPIAWNAQSKPVKKGSTFSHKMRFCGRLGGDVQKAYFLGVQNPSKLNLATGLVQRQNKIRKDLKHMISRFSHKTGKSVDRMCTWMYFIELFYVYSIQYWLSYLVKTCRVRYSSKFSCHLILHFVHLTILTVYCSVMKTKWQNQLIQFFYHLPLALSNLFYQQMTTYI